MLRIGVTGSLCACTEDQGSHALAMRNRVKSMVLSAASCAENRGPWSTWGPGCTAALCWQEGSLLHCGKQTSLCACLGLKSGGTAALCELGVWLHECTLWETDYQCLLTQAQIQVAQFPYVGVGSDHASAPCGKQPPSVHAPKLNSGSTTALCGCGFWSPELALGNSLQVSVHQAQIWITQVPCVGRRPACTERV